MNQSQASRQALINPNALITDIIMYENDLDSFFAKIPEKLDLDDISSFNYQSPSFKTLESSLNVMNDYIEACTDIKNAQMEGPDKVDQLKLDPELKGLRNNLIKVNEELYNGFQTIKQYPSINQITYTIETIDPQVSVETNELNDELKSITPVVRYNLFLQNSNIIKDKDDDEPQKNEKSMFKSRLIDQFMEKKPTVSDLPKQRTKASHSAVLPRGNSTSNISAKVHPKSNDELEKEPEVPNTINEFSSLFKEKLSIGKNRKRVTKIIDPIIDSTEIEVEPIIRDDPKHLIELNKNRRTVPKLPPKPVEPVEEAGQTPASNNTIGKPLSLNPAANKPAIAPTIGVPAKPLVSGGAPKAPPINTGVGTPATTPLINPAKPPGVVTTPGAPSTPAPTTPAPAPALSRGNGQTNLNSQKAITVIPPAESQSSFQPIPLPPESSWNNKPGTGPGIGGPKPFSTTAGANAPKTPFGAAAGGFNTSKPAFGSVATGGLSTPKPFGTQNTGIGAKPVGNPLGAKPNGITFGGNAGIWKNK